jgi:restriction endonuclease Mrr
LSTASTASATTWASAKRLLGSCASYGVWLVDLMNEHGVGVEPIKVATIHRINKGLFDELRREINSPPRSEVGIGSR